MAIAWFLCPYHERKAGWRRVRYCAMDEFTTDIYADKGTWSETEVLGNAAIVKVKAADATLDKIAQAEGFTRLPLQLLDDKLSTLTLAQRNAIKDKVLALGYTLDDISTLGNLRDKTLAEVLRFVASRRKKARYDATTDTIILDGDTVACKSVDDVDKEVS